MFTGNSQSEVKITIESRSATLVLIFDDISLISHGNASLIDGINAEYIDMIVVGNVSLLANDNTQTASPALISCNNLNIYGDGVITMKGADSTGHDHFNGIPGSPALAANGIVCLSVKDVKIYGGNGADGDDCGQAPNQHRVPPKQTEKGKPGEQGFTGENGQTGSSGGAGGAAVVGATAIINNNNYTDCFLRPINNKTNVLLVGGNGGDGGPGEKGGKGGTGGEGRDGTLFVYGTVGGRGGTGGRGGNGGPGGKGAQATLNVGEIKDCICQDGVDGLIGYKGEGGEGGNGGLGGEKMIGGERYASGAQGEKGLDGLYGRDR